MCCHCPALVHECNAVAGDREGGRGRKEAEAEAGGRKGVEAGRGQRQEAGRGQRQEVGQKQEEDRGRGISEIEFSLVHRESSRRARPTY